jgi:hypothetical protein
LTFTRLQQIGFPKPLTLLLVCQSTFLEQKDKPTTLPAVLPEFVIVTETVILSSWNVFFNVRLE